MKFEFYLALTPTLNDGEDYLSIDERRVSPRRSFRVEAWSMSPVVDDERTVDYFTDGFAIMSLQDIFDLIHGQELIWNELSKPISSTTNMLEIEVLLDSSFDEYGLVELYCNENSEIVRSEKSI